MKYEDRSFSLFLLLLLLLANSAEIKQTREEYIKMLTKRITQNIQNLHLKDILWVMPMSGFASFTYQRLAELHDSSLAYTDQGPDTNKCPTSLSHVP